MMIFIHGAWHGSFIWDGIAGESGLAPDLDLSPGADLLRHIAQIESLLISPTVLIGHSYGAAVAHLVASRNPALVTALIALDGFILRPKQSIMDLIPPRIRTQWLQSPLIPPLGLDVMAIPEARRDWLAPRLRPQPLASFTQPAPAFTPYTGPKTYVRAEGFSFPPFDRIAARCAQEAWHVEKIACGHDVMIEEEGLLFLKEKKQRNFQ